MDYAKTYHWQNRLNNLIFLFTFHSYKASTEMTVFVYALQGDDIGSVQKESILGTVVFIDTIVSGFPLNGDIWIEPGENNEYRVRADLCYGNTGAEQELEVIMFVYEG